MFCSHCGSKIPDDSQVCPECGQKTGAVTKEKVKIKLEPIVAVGFVFSAIALICGFVLITMSFVNGWSALYSEFLGILPAFVGLGIGIYKLFSDGVDKTNRCASAISAIASGFTLLYVFIGFIVQIA